MAVCFLGCLVVIRLVGFGGYCCRLLFWLWITVGLGLLVLGLGLRVWVLAIVVFWDFCLLVVGWQCVLILFCVCSLV